MNTNVSSTVNPAFWSFPNLQDFRTAADAVGQQPVQPQDPDALGGPEEPVAQKPDAPSEKEPVDTGMSRFVGGSGESSLAKPLFDEAKLLAANHRISAKPPPPEEAVELGVSTEKKKVIATAVFGSPSKAGTTVLDEKAELLAGMLERKLAKDAPLDDAAKLKVRDVVRKALDKMLETKAVQEKFTDAPTVSGGCQQILFQALVQQANLDELSRAISQYEDRSKDRKVSEDAVKTLLTRVLDQQRHLADLQEKYEAALGIVSKGDEKNLPAHLQQQVAEVQQQLMALQSQIGKLTTVSTEEAKSRQVQHRVTEGLYAREFVRTEDLERLKEALTEQPEDIRKYSLSEDVVKNIQSNIPLKMRDFGDMLLNGALGIAEKMYAGDIAEDTVVTLIDEAHVYSLEKPEDVLQMQVKVSADIREAFTQEKAISNYLAELKRTRVDTNQMPQTEYAAIANRLTKLVAARKMFTRVLDVGVRPYRDENGKVDAAAVKEQLADLKARYTQFRYDLQRSAGLMGRETARYRWSPGAIMERLRRFSDNLFTRGKRVHADQRFASDKSRDSAYAELKKLEEDEVTRNLLAEVKAGTSSLEDRARHATDISHEVNTGVRYHLAAGKDRTAMRRYAENVATALRTNGGTRAFSTDISLSLFAKFTGGVVNGSGSFGGFHKVSASVSAGKDGAFVLDLYAKDGVRFNVTVDVLSELAKFGVTGEIAGGEGVRLKFATVDDFVTFAQANAPKLLQQIPGEIDYSGKTPITAQSLGIPRTYGLLTVFKNIFKGLATLTGFRIHQSKYFQDAAFEQHLRSLDVFGELDRIDAGKQNGVAIWMQKYERREGSLKASADFGVSEKTTGNVTTKTEPKMSASLTGAGNSDVNVRSRDVRTAEAMFKYDATEDMAGSLFDRECRRFRDRMAEYGPATNAAKNAKVIEEFCTSLIRADADVKEPKEKADVLVKSLHALRKLRNKCHAITANLGYKALGDEHIQKLYADRMHLLAFVNETLARKAEDLLREVGDRNADVADLCKTAVAMARGSLAPLLSNPPLRLSGTILEENLLFGEDLADAKSTTVSFKGSFSWNLNPETTTTEKKTNPIDIVKTYVTKELPKEALGTLQNTVKNLTLYQKGEVGFDVAWKKFAAADDGKRPFGKQDNLTIGLTLSYPLNPLSMILAAIQGLHEAREKLAKEDGGQGEDAQNPNPLGQAILGAIAELGKQVNTILLDTADTLVSKTVMKSPLVTAPVGAAVAGINKVLDKLGVKLSGPESTETSSHTVRVAFSFDEGIFSKFSVEDNLSVTKSISMKLASMPGAAQAGVEFKYQKSHSQSTLQCVCMPSPPMTSFLAGYLDAQTTKNGKTFLATHQLAVNTMIGEYLSNRSELSRIGPNPKGDGVSFKGPFHSKDVRFQIIANIRRDMEKLRLIAQREDVPTGLRKESEELYAALFTKRGNKENKAAGIWERISTPDEEMASTDASRVDLMAELFDKLGAAYGLITRVAEKGVKVGVAALGLEGFEVPHPIPDEAS